MSEKIEKAESIDKVVTRPLTAEKGQPFSVTSSRFIRDTKIKDLEIPNRFSTFDRMAQDDAVYNSIDVNNLLVMVALYRGSYVAPVGASSTGKAAAEFLNYNIRNMTTGTWLDFINNANTDLKYGFSFQNIVLEKRNYGEYKGNFVLKKLSPRDQKSIHGWVWDKDFREFRGFVQKPNKTQFKIPTVAQFEAGITDVMGNGFYKKNYPFLSTDRLLHFKYNSTNNNPQGDPPLLHCYDAWMEKKLIERYEIVGVSKDFGGAIVLRVPSKLIEQANDPTTYPDSYAEYENLQRDAGLLQAGESSYIVLTSDVDEHSNKLYDFELKGIDGGGKQYKSSEIIDQKRKSIYNVFGAGFLLLGQNGHGSNALSSNQMTTHDYYVERNTISKCDVLDNQLAPRLLAANNVSLSYKDMPVFVPADPSKPDLDVISKVIQRAKSVGGITPKALESLYKTAGWDTEGIEDLDFTDKGDSRAGESGGTSGTGNSQGGGKKSSTNSANKSLRNEETHSTDIETNYVVDYETDDQIIAVNSQDGKPLYINKQE